MQLSPSAARELGELIRERRASPRSQMGGARGPGGTPRRPGPMPFQVGIFELIDSLSAGGSVQAYRQIFNPAETVSIYETDDSEEYTLYDHLGMFEGNPGDLCKAELMRDSGQWSIYQKVCL